MMKIKFDILGKIAEKTNEEVLQSNEIEDLRENCSLVDDGNDYFKDESEPNEFFKFSEEDIMTADEFVDSNNYFDDDNLL